MRPELYVTAAALASTSYVVLMQLGVPGAGPTFDRVVRPDLMLGR
jgi:uncharacterized membrane protein YeiH